MTLLEPLAGTLLNAAIEALLSRLFEPLADSVIKGIPKHVRPDDADERLRELLTAYLSRTYQQLSHLSALALQNQHRELLQLYVPLTVADDTTGKTVRLDRFHSAFLPRHRRVLLTDSAGMGKSTLLKFLFLSCIHHNKGIPIFVELRRLSADRSLLEHLAAELSPTPQPADSELILHLLRNNNIVFLLDGYDEIPADAREPVSLGIQQFLSRYSKSATLVSSRPETTTGVFADFHRFSIVGLTLEESFELLRRYDRGGPKAEEIIHKLASKAFAPIHEFLSNPMLVSLLYRAYEHKASIPPRKHIFYRQVFDALYDSHDLSKGAGFTRQKKCGLDIDDCHSVLRALGMITLKIGAVEYQVEDLLGYISKAKNRCPGMEFKERAFLEDMLTTVPLFLKDGTYVRWSHKSLQEYFAAQFICVDAKGRETEALSRLYTSPDRLRYSNVLDLCADMDFRAFRQAVVRAVLHKFSSHCSTSYDSSTLGGSDRELLSRREIGYARTFFLTGKAASSSRERGGGAIPGITWSTIFGDSDFEGPWRAFAIPIPTTNVFLVVLESDEWQFIELLGDKQVIPYDVGHSRRNRTSLRHWPEALVEHAALEVVKLDDNPTSLWNSQAHFSTITRALEELKLPHLRWEDSATLLSQIEAEVASEDSAADDFMP